MHPPQTTTRPASQRSAAAGAWFALLLGLCLPALACRSGHPSRSPIGERFPSLSAESLAGQKVELPPLGQPSVLLIGYTQDAQFDADRWLLGLLQAELPRAVPGLRILEVPTIPSLLASMAGGLIDSGMRSGIPSEDWASVVTVYGSQADAIARFTGNQPTRNIRALLLDSDGRLRWMHDRGYSAAKLLEMFAVARTLVPENAPR